MEYVEENVAKELHRALTQRMVTEPANGVENASVTVDGGGLHWHCTATWGVRRCVTHCFGIQEYLTYFQHDGQPMATARTDSQPGTIEAVADWLADSDVSELHEKFAFVDAWKRALWRIQQAVLSRVPELATLDASELKDPQSEFCFLQFRHGDRLANLKFYGKNTNPDADPMKSVNEDLKCCALWKKRWDFQFKD